MFARIDRRRKLPVTIILRALGMNEEQILDMFFDKNTFYIGRRTRSSSSSCPQRLRGETATLRDPHRRQGHRRGRPPHHRAPRARSSRTPRSSACTCRASTCTARCWRTTWSNTDTGEMLAKANEVLTAATVEKLIEAGIDRSATRCTPTTSTAARTSPTRCASTRPRRRLEALVEIYRMMRPGEPPTKDAAENLFNNLFFNQERYDLSAVGRMKFNRRVGRKEIIGSACCTTTSTSDAQRRVSKVLVEARRSSTSSTCSGC